MVSEHLKQIAKVNKFNKWVLHELNKNKGQHFEVLMFFHQNSNDPSLDWYVTKNEWKNKQSD